MRKSIAEQMIALGLGKRPEPRRREPIVERELPSVPFERPVPPSSFLPSASSGPVDGSRSCRECGCEFPAQAMATTYLCLGCNGGDVERLRGEMIWHHKTAPTLVIEGRPEPSPEEQAAMRRR